MKRLIILVALAVIVLADSDGDPCEGNPCAHGGTCYPLSDPDDPSSSNGGDPHPSKGKDSHSGDETDLQEDGGDTNRVMQLTGRWGATGKGSKKLQEEIKSQDIKSQEGSSGTSKSGSSNSGSSKSGSSKSGDSGCRRTFVCICNPGFFGNACEQECKIDLGFIIDESGSVSAADWQIALEFAANFSSMLSISPTSAQVGVVTFDSLATLDIKLNQYSDTASLLAAIIALPKGNGGTAIHEGLKASREQCFIAANGDRVDVPNVAVLLTDGKSSDSLAIQEADLLKATGATIVTVGIGSVDQLLLETIASSPDLFFYITDYANLYKSLTRIVLKSCGIVPVPP